MSGIEVSGEQDGSSMNPVLQDEQIVERARKDGWKPLEEFKGDAATWVDAKEFVAREPLLKEIRDLKKHIRSQREQTDRDMTVITSQFNQMSELAYKKAVSDLEAQRDLAIQDQDIKAVRDLDKQIDQVSADHDKNVAASRPQQRVNDTLKEELDQWRADNSWFDNDQELQDEAVTIGVGYMAKNPKKSQADMLKHVEDRVKKIYPDKFQSQQRTTKVEDDEDVTRVEGRSNVRPSGNRKGKLGVSDLDEDEKSIMKTLIKRGVLKDVAAKNKRSEQEEFLAQLAERKAK